MKKIDKITKSIISKKALSNFAVAGITLVFAFIDYRLLVVMLLAVVIYEILFYRHNKKISTKGNLFLYYAPSVYIINILVHGGVPTEMHLVSAVLAICVALGMAFYEPFIRKLYNNHIVVVGLEEAQSGIRKMSLANNWGWYILTVAALVAYVVLPAASVALFSFLIVIIGALFVTYLLRGKSSATVDELNLKKIIAYKPKFAVMFSTGQEGIDNYMMWDKYFKMVDEPFVILTPHKKHLQTLGRATSIPVVYYTGARDIEKILFNNDIKAVFYTSSAPSDINALSSLNQLHVAVFHGDSDKASSYHPSSSMYDKIFASGQVAIDRYKKHGVSIPDEKFVIVGRPQVANINKIDGHQQEISTVLYAPTWQGNVEHMNYTSLYKGREIIKLLLNNNLRVIFRPHPHTYTSPELLSIVNDIHDMLSVDSINKNVEHIYGSEASGADKLNDLINESDMLISDVSSVTTDYLHSNKPIILINMRFTEKDFVENFPIAKAAYVVDKNLTTLKDSLQSIIKGKDVLEGERVKMAEYYLNDSLGNDSYENIFVDAVKDILIAPNPHYHDHRN